MAATLVNLTGNIADLIGTDFDTRRTKVWVTTNLPADVLIDADGNTVRLGDAYATVATDGTFTFTGLWATNSATNPTAFQYQLHVDYPKRSAGNGRQTWSSGWFDLTATADIADVVQGQYVPPTWMTTATATLQGYVDDAAASEADAEAAATAAAASAALADSYIVADLNTSDGQMEALIESPTSLTSGALSATYVPRGEQPFRVPEQYGAVGDGTTDDSAALAAALVDSRIVRCTPGKTYIVSDLDIPGSRILDLNQAVLRRKTGATYAINADQYRPFVINGQVRGDGTWTTTTTSGGAALGATALTVTSTAGLVAGMKILYASAWADGGVELNEIDSVAGTTVNLKTALRGAVASGTKVAADFPLIRSVDGDHGVFENLLVTDCLIGMETGGEDTSGANTFAQYSQITFRDCLGVGLFIGPNSAAENYTDVKVNGGKTQTTNYVGDGTTVRFAAPYSLRKHVDRWGAEPSVRFILNGVQQASTLYTVDTATMEIVCNTAPANGATVSVQNYEYSAFGIVARNINPTAPSAIGRMSGMVSIACRVGVWFDSAMLAFMSNVTIDTCSYAGLLLTDSDSIYMRGVDSLYTPFSVIVDAASSNVMMGSFATSSIADSQELPATPSKSELVVRTGATNVVIDHLSWFSRSGYTQNVATSSYPTGKLTALRPTGLAVGGDVAGLAMLYGTSGRSVQVNTAADQILMGGGSGYKYIRATGTNPTLDIGAAVSGGSVRLTCASGTRLEITNTGKVILASIPTSSAGLPSGALWSNAGVINIVP